MFCDQHFFWVVTTQNKNVFCGLDFSGCDHLEQKLFCGQEQKRPVLWSGIVWVCGLSEQKRDVLWSGIFRVGTFCGQEYFTTDRFVAKNILRTRDLC